MTHTRTSPATSAPTPTTPPAAPTPAASSVPARAVRGPAPYLVPALLAVGLTMYGPLLAVTALSLFDFNLTTQTPRWVGADNYREVFASPETGTALRNTVAYMATILPLSVLAPGLAAIAVWRFGGRLTGFYRTVFFLPVLIPPAVGAVMWQWIFNPVLGIADAPLELLGLGPVSWLTQPVSAFVAVTIVAGWKVFGLSFILFTAGLTAIDANVMAAARLDRAGEWQLLRHIVVPLLRPVTTVVVFATVVFVGPWTFGVIDVLTQGGPAGATSNVYYLLYQLGFGYVDGGPASALSVLITVGFGAVVAAQMRLSGRRAGR
ncbi:carbohydrate ABC transporter permease [Phytoactinopolyspora halotolerans]|uniref:Sugar ABC transporter permease n=1 Tax=Phytoactinopolyspora halotolerans TaxID=1981512 RepID=A0A6L9SE58_9ACTN|nr:sugar ABC transporter permease [Phytoactinopolyspora halotolerans]NEE02828.1 sugar ABC transporter permease [Phytoactinopolyspora halotolerans]